MRDDLKRQTAINYKGDKMMTVVERITAGSYKRVTAGDGKRMTADNGKRITVVTAGDGKRTSR